MELLRTMIQPSINEEIKRVMQKFSDTFFVPAVKNAVSNLGSEKVNQRLVEEVCINALENAKSIFAKVEKKKAKKAKRKRPLNAGEPNGLADKRSKVGDTAKMVRPNTDLIFVSKTGKPVRREGPKWEAERLNPDTLFILGSRANKGLGFGQTRGRLYIKHPELFK